jgi:hypothetical protein
VTVVSVLSSSWNTVTRFCIALVEPATHHESNSSIAIANQDEWAARKNAKAMRRQIRCLDSLEEVNLMAFWRSGTTA